MERRVCESDQLPNEILFGRVGYLYGLLLLQQEMGDHVVPASSIINVSG